MPDSSSSAPESRLLTPTPRSTLNTAAASVEDSTAPHSSAVRHSRSSSRCSPTPTTPMLTSTETVDRATPTPSAGRTARQDVVRPPSTRMRTSAASPSDPVRCGVGERDAQPRLAQHRCRCRGRAAAREAPSRTDTPDREDAEQDHGGPDPEQDLELRHAHPDDRASPVPAGESRVSPRRVPDFGTASPASRHGESRDPTRRVRHSCPRRRAERGLRRPGPERVSPAIRHGEFGIRARGRGGPRSFSGRVDGAVDAGRPVTTEDAGRSGAPGQGGGGAGAGEVVEGGGDLGHPLRR